MVCLSSAPIRAKPRVVSRIPSSRLERQHVPRLRPPASADLTGSTCGKPAHLREYRLAALEYVIVSGHSCAPAAGTGSAGPVNSASIENSTKSPTPIVVPGAGTPNVIPKSDRLNEPCAENPTRA